MRLELFNLPFCDAKRVQVEFDEDKIKIKERNSFVCFQTIKKSIEMIHAKRLQSEKIKNEKRSRHSLSWTKHNVKT